MKKIKLLALSTFSMLCMFAHAQSPSFGTTGFDNSAYDQVPFASGSAYPSVMTATNVANTYWNFHIGAVGVYVITQVDKSTGGAYDGAITASNVTPTGFPVLYQTFAFSTPGLTKFKLNSVKVRIYNSGSTPVPMLLAGVVGTSAGSTTSFVAMPGSNWYTINTSTDPNFYNINGVIAINGTGSTAVGEMAYDDIDISTAVTGNPLPTFTSQPTDKTVCSSASTTFTASASNAASYFWLMSSDGLIWNPITSSNAGTVFSGYNTNTLTVSQPATSLNGLYISLTAVNSTGGNQSSNAVRLYVNAEPNAGSITGASSVCLGSNLSLSNSVSGGTWSSSSPGVASINASGLVTSVSSGTTVIKYLVTNGSGCSDSTTKSISVNTSTSSSTSISICSNALPYIWNGNSYTSAGSYTVHLTNVNGCDSAATLQLNIKAATSSTANASVCVSSLPYNWNGNSYNTSGTYTLHFTNSVGCDSSAILVLNVLTSNNVNAGTITGPNSVCVGSNVAFTNAVPGGIWSITAGRASINSSGVVTGTSAGTTSIKYTVGNGICTASTTKSITVNAVPAIPSIAFAPGTTGISSAAGYCTNKTFTLLGSPAGGIWSGTGGLTINASSGVVNIGSIPGPIGVTYTYTNSNNCSSSRTISSTAVACSHRGVAYTSSSAKNEFVIYPNPAKNYFNVNLTTIESGAKITIVDLMGKQLQTQLLSIGSNRIDISKLSKGIYTINVSGVDGITPQKLIVE